MIEITGQPCSGKSTFIAREIANKSDVRRYHQSQPRKIINFISGLRYLGFYRSKILFVWSLNECAPFAFRLNIFRNAVMKFGVFANLVDRDVESSQRVLVDEGLSHLAFLFINTDPRRVVDFIENELKQSHVIFLASPGLEIIESRLSMRGHKRLTFFKAPRFSRRNQEIEIILLEMYPNLCERFYVY